jgi:hypothetical protein
MTNRIGFARLYKPFCIVVSEVCYYPFKAGIPRPPDNPSSRQRRLTIFTRRYATEIQNQPVSIPVLRDRAKLMPPLRGEGPLDVCRQHKKSCLVFKSRTPMMPDASSQVRRG